MLDQTVKGVAKSVHKLGLPFIKNTVTRIEEAIAANYDPAVEPSNAPEQMSLGQLLASCKTLSALIRSEGERLGLESDRHGIERRGAEVHISLASPAAAAAPTAGTEVSAAGR